MSQLSFEDLGVEVESGGGYSKLCFVVRGRQAMLGDEHDYAEAVTQGISSSAASEDALEHA